MLDSEGSARASAPLCSCASTLAPGRGPSFEGFASQAPGASPALPAAAVTVAATATAAAAAATEAAAAAAAAAAEAAAATTAEATAAATALTVFRLVHTQRAAIHHGAVQLCDGL